MERTPASSQRHLLRVVVLWIVLSVLGDAIVYLLAPHMVDWGILSPVASARADAIDQVLGLFTYLAVPVFVGVVTFALYTIFAFRSRRSPRR